MSGIDLKKEFYNNFLLIMIKYYYFYRYTKELVNIICLSVILGIIKSNKYLCLVEFLRDN